MHRFYLIDHSLKKVGGHHFEYALHVLQAAAAAGYQPVLAAHRKFHAVAHLPADWQVFTPYRESTYCSAAIMGQLPLRMPPVSEHDRRANSLRGWRFRLQEWLRKQQGARRTRAFTAGTTQLFAALPPQPGDHALLATINELDLLGAMEYWRHDPQSANVDWHLQFHFNIEPDWPTSPERCEFYRQQLRDVFDTCRQEFPRHRLHYYNTTDQLAEQYNRLGKTHFVGLPYPTNPKFQLAKVPAAPGQPLRVTCVGGVRAEKGIQSTVRLIDDLWDDTFAAGKARLVIQAESPKKLPPAVQARLPEADNTATSPLSLVPHPLSTDDYRQLIVTTDIGLLLYDRKQYQARCSGILVEMLSAGVPVVVPAGCWLADQIASAIYAHRQSQITAATAIGDERTPWRGEFTDAAQRTYAVPAGATQVGLSLRWQPVQVQAGYAQLTLRSWDADNVELPPVAETLCIPTVGQAAVVWAQLPAGATRIELRLQDAYGRAAFAVAQSRLKFCHVADNLPTGAVGQIVHSAAEVAPAVREIIAHYTHYEQTAAAFARRWIAWHSPARVVQELTTPPAQRQAA